MIPTIDFCWRNVPFPYRCDGCPYPRVGFTCRDRDGHCTRTDVEKLTERQRKPNNRALLHFCPKISRSGRLLVPCDPPAPPKKYPSWVRKQV